MDLGQAAGDYLYALSICGWKFLDTRSPVRVLKAYFGDRVGYLSTLSDLPQELHAEGTDFLNRFTAGLHARVLASDSA